MSPQNWQSWYAGKTVVITGGNSGIGYEMAIEACKAGAKTFICGRDENTVSSSLEMLRAVQPDADGMVANLIDPDGFAAFIGKLKKLDDIHILINNAGIGDFGVVAVAEPENLGRMVRTNVEVLTVLTAKLLPAIKAHGTEGGILNLGSILSWFPSPGSAAYSATKSFALNFTEALRYELKEDGVHVCGLYPGGTRSRFAERAGLSEANKEIRLEQPSFVAREGLKGLALNKPRIIPGKMIKVKTVIMRLMPARIRSKIV